MVVGTKVQRLTGLKWLKMVDGAEILSSLPAAASSRASLPSRPLQHALPSPTAIFATATTHPMAPGPSANLNIGPHISAHVSPPSVASALYSLDRTPPSRFHDVSATDPYADSPQGKPLVIELWATWCGPCRQIFPHLSDIARKFRPRGLVVAGITQEEDSPRLQQFVDQQGAGMDYNVAVDEGGAVEQLAAKAMVRGIPHSFVCDREGTILYSGHPGQPSFEQAVAKACEHSKETRSREELAALPAKELKAILTGRGIGVSDLVEKSEFVDRILERCT